MNTYNITYTDLTLWIEKQETVSRIQEVTAPSQEAAVEWFLENVQGDYDSIELESIDTIRERVCEYIHYGLINAARFKSADIVWVEGYEGWVLVGRDKNNDRYWRGPENNTAKFLELLDDDEICEFYNEHIAEETVE